MKTVYKLTAILLIFTVGLVSCSESDLRMPNEITPAQPIHLTARQIEKLNTTNYFSFKIFREVSRLQEKPNTFFSPLSLNLALGMLYNGTTGETRTEMAEVLGIDHFTDAEINEYFQKMMQALLNIDPLTEISIANSIWYRDSDCFYVKQSFRDINRTYFDAEVRGLDFDRPDAVDIINQWCSDKTNGRITEIIDKINDDVVMYLINALYFKSKWKFEFDRANTRSGDFTKAKGQTTRVNLMTQTAGLRYFQDQYLSAVELPYGNEAFSMVLILPTFPNTCIDKLVEHLDNDTWQNIVENLHEQNINLRLPRFRVESDIPLNCPVQNAGMQRIFQGGLENIGHSARGPLAVSNIKQKTFVEVNEEGTEAAAVTVVEVIAMSLQPNMPIPFHANRPFLYLIREQSTGTILFIGRMDDPTE
ncbi:MAG: serpin family protein [Bacteroidales bacterium]|nr:serpin family protein [Bacteroidales bacterium]